MINELTLIGRVGKKDTRTLKNDTAMTTIYLATYKKWTDKEGIKQEQTTWHNVNFFDKLAEYAAKYAHVGDRVYIKGQVNHKQLVEGEKKGQWVYSVTAKEIQLLTDKKDSAAIVTSKPVVVHDNTHDYLNDQIPF